MKRLIILSYFFCVFSYCIKAQNDWDVATSGRITYNGGNVGIGTSTPQETLHVFGSAYFKDVIGGVKINSVVSEVANQFIRSSILFSRNGDLEWDDVNDLWTLGSGNYNDFAAIIHRSNGQLSFYTGDGNNFTTISNSNFRNQYERFTIIGNGNVGIGTDTPSAKLNVVGDAFKWENNLGDTNAKLIIEDGSGLANPALKFYRWTGSSSNFYPGHIELTQSGGVSRMDFRMGPTASVGSESMTTVLSVENTGNVGIGTTTPSSKLHVLNGTEQVRVGYDASNYLSTSISSLGGVSFAAAGTNPIFDFNQTIIISSGLNIGQNVILNRPSTSGYANYQIQTAGINAWAVGVRATDTHFGIYDEVATVDRLSILTNGNVGIGTTNPDEKLTVAGNIHAQEVKVTIGAGTGPDYVFEPDYNLPKLESIEKFIKSNNHLPEIPSAKEMEANGVQLGEMNMLLLKKIEELTLYTIGHESKLSDQSKEILDIKSSNQQLRIDNEELRRDNGHLKQNIEANNLKLEALLSRIEKLEKR